MLTNYKTWIFVRYSLLSEVETVPKISNSEVAAKFEVSQEVDLWSDDYQQQSHPDINQ